MSRRKSEPREQLPLPVTLTTDTTTTLHRARHAWSCRVGKAARCARCGVVATRENGFGERVSCAP